MRRLWVLAFVAVIALAGATTAQASGTGPALGQEAVLLAQIFSSEAPECPTPEAGPALGVPEPVPNACLSYYCRQPCQDHCQSIGCATVCTDTVACTCGCACM